MGNILRALVKLKKKLIKKFRLSPKKVKPIDYMAEGPIPDIFIQESNQNFLTDIRRKPTFLYIPWVKKDTDALIEKFKNDAVYQIEPFEILRDPNNLEARMSALDFSRLHPVLYKRMIFARLLPIYKYVKGVIFTFDWSPVMRLVVEVCRELGLRTILIPHESVFFHRLQYYKDRFSMASMPLTDVVWGWGELQRDVFLERGYPPERFEIVGAPKFDAYNNYEPDIGREEFFQFHRLDKRKKTILYAAQDVDDSEPNFRQALLDAQRNTIKDLVTFCKEHDAQLLLRLPPARFNLLNTFLTGFIPLEDHDCVAVDFPGRYLSSPECAIFHADIIASLNSTMLIESLILNRPSLSIQYLSFDSIWDETTIPTVHDKEQLYAFLEKSLFDTEKPANQPVCLAELARLFGCGEFDGLAASRIQQKLTAITKGQDSIAPLKCGVERLLEHGRLDVASLAIGDKNALSTHMKYLPGLMGANTVADFRSASAENLISVDLFVQWGITNGGPKIRQQRLARALGTPIVFIEGGFIFSPTLNLVTNEPGLSIVWNDMAAYYDATQPSRLELTLNGPRELDASALRQSRESIEYIVRNRVTKYNHAPDYCLELGEKGRQKILLLDQRFGDSSVNYGMGSPETFQRMLDDALTMYSSSHDIIIKRHPDAIKGGKECYFSNAFIAPVRNRVLLLDQDINPYALLDLVDEVFVCTSGMGFEALMAGKKVHCYGMPFYAGWGLTNDKITLDRRTRQRTLEEVFYLAYIEFSRYWNPDTGRLAAVKEMVDYIVRHRQQHSTKGC